MNRQDAKDAKSRTCEPTENLDHCAHAVIGAAIEVHRHLGPGFLEAVYEEAMVIELEIRGLRVERQVRVPLSYKGRPLPTAQLDLLVEGELVVELKAVTELSAVHQAQVLSYLKAGAFQLGLLINFNVPVLKQGLRRIVHTG